MGNTLIVSGLTCTGASTGGGRLSITGFLLPVALIARDNPLITRPVRIDSEREGPD